MSGLLRHMSSPHIRRVFKGPLLPNQNRNATGGVIDTSFTRHTDSSSIYNYKRKDLFHLIFERSLSKNMKIF